MDIITSVFGQLNWWAIIVATLSTMPVGFVWYSTTIGFGSTWAKLNGLSTKDLESTANMGPIFATMLATSLLTAVFISVLLVALDITGLWDSLLWGIVFGLLFRGGSHVIHNGFTRKPTTLTLIDAGHDTVSLALITLIVGLWR